MNYDILGLIVQNISHSPYSSYMSEHIFKPLNMKHISTKESNKKAEMMLRGMIFNIIKHTQIIQKFNIGDNPAAYLMASTHDLEPWIKFQLHPQNI